MLSEVKRSIRKGAVAALTAIVLALAGNAVCGTQVDGGAKQAHGLPGGVSLKTKFSTGGATFTIEGGDIPQVFAARELLARCAGGLKLSEGADRQEFLACYSKERRDRPELGKLVIACLEFQLPNSPEAVSAPSFGHAESAEPAGLQAQTRRKMVDLLLGGLRQPLKGKRWGPESDAAKSFGNAVVSLETWVARNMNGGNVMAIADGIAFATSEVFGDTLRKRYKDAVDRYDQRVHMPGVSAAVEGEDESHLDFGIRDPEKSKNSWCCASRVGPIGYGCAGVMRGGRLFSACVLKADKDLVAAYQVDGGTVMPVSVKLVEIGEDSVAARAGTGTEGTVRLVVVSPEVGGAIGKFFLSEALELFDKPTGTRGRPVLNLWWTGTTGGLGTPPGWIESRRDRWVANVYDAPAGGYLAVAGSGEVKGVFGPGFTASQTDNLKGFRDEAGNVFTLPVTAYTYQGSDGRYHSFAIAENGQAVMYGVWLDGANRTASNCTDRAQFKTISTKLK